MVTPSLKHVLATALVLGAPGVVVLAALVAFGALAVGPAVAAAIALLCLITLLVLRPLGRLRALRARIERNLSRRADEPAAAAPAPADDPGGGPIGDLAVAYQRLERNWQHDRKLLRDGLTSAAMLFDALPDPLVTLDRHARLAYANKAARALFAEGRPGEDVHGRDLSAVLRQPLVLEAVGEVLAGADTRAVEFTFTDRVDQTFEARVETIGGGEAGDDDAVALLLLRDVTALRRGERLRADFVANVSHELRTPLASLIGFIETLRGPAKDDREARERFLELMDHQSARMARLVDDLLSLSRIEMNEHTLPEQSVDLRSVIASVVDLLAPQARERNIALVPRLDAVTHYVVGDHDELIQLFQNLVENAIKYGRENTSVRIDAAADADTITVSVIDQGEGIAREHLPRLTERFYRVDTARSRELGGTGLGLSIVKHIVNRHRGELRIESTQGEGSTFAVSLRAAAPLNAATESRAAAASP